MRIINDKISINELVEIAQGMFGNLVKAVVDVEKKIMVIGGELHSDEEALLIENGSKQQDLWGINLYPEIESNDWIGFDSMINLKPSQGNRSCGIDNPEIKKIIIEIITNMVEK